MKMGILSGIHQQLCLAPGIHLAVVAVLFPRILFLFMIKELTKSKMVQIRFSRLSLTRIMMAFVVQKIRRVKYFFG